MFKTILVTAFLVLALTCAAPAAAVYANGTFTFSNIGDTVGWTGLANSFAGATTISIPTPTGTTNCGIVNVCEQVLQPTPQFYKGTQNTFANALLGGSEPVGLLDDITFNSYTFDLSFLTLPVLHFTQEFVPPGRFSFTADNGTLSFASINGSDFLNLAYQGTFHDVLGVYHDNTASLSLTFTQPTDGGPGSASYTGTFATQAPEPAPFFLLGGALLGIGILKRKPKKA